MWALRIRPAALSLGTRLKRACLAVKRVRPWSWLLLINALRPKPAPTSKIVNSLARAPMADARVAPRPGGAGLPASAFWVQEGPR